MNKPMLLPTKLNVDAAWSAYSKLLCELHDDPSLADDPEYEASIAEAETQWRDLFVSWAKTDPQPRKRAI